MTDSKAYRELLLLIECLKRRESCNRNCLECPFGSRIMDTTLALGYVIGILKARSPELYFLDDLNQLKEILENGNQDQET